MNDTTRQRPSVPPEVAGQRPSQDHPESCGSTQPAAVSVDSRPEFDPYNQGWKDGYKKGAWANTQPAAVPAYQPMTDETANLNGVAWAVSRWQDEVSQRPLVNVHRRTLDDTWRQVIRYFGGDPEKLLGPNHDTLHLQEQEARAWKP